MQIDIDINGLEALKKTALAKAQEDYRNDDNADNLMCFELEAEDIEHNVEKGEITISGNLKGKDSKDNKHDFGYIYFNLPIALELAKEIIEYYTKKLNKMKTVLEAIDD